MLVKSARAVCVPRIELGCNAEMNKPVHLDSLPVCLWLVSRDNLTVFGNLQKLCLSHFVSFLLSHFSSKSGITLAENDNGVTHNAHSVELVALFHSLWVVHIVEGVKSIFDVLLIV